MLFFDGLEHAAGVDSRHLRTGVREGRRGEGMGGKERGWEGVGEEGAREGREGRKGGRGGDGRGQDVREGGR
jgi:hypothetical protein